MYVVNNYKTIYHISIFFFKITETNGTRAQENQKAKLEDGCSCSGHSEKISWMKDGERKGTGEGLSMLLSRGLLYF